MSKKFTQITIFLVVIIMFVYSNIKTAKEYFLYIFNLPIDQSLFIVEDQNIWIHKDVLELIRKRVEVKELQKYYNNLKNMYDLVSICNENKDKLVLSINKDTKIIDVNTKKFREELKENLLQNKNLFFNKTYSVMETKYFKVFYTNQQLGIILSNLLDYYYESISNFLGVKNEDIRKNKVPIYLAPTDDVYKSYKVVPDWSSGAFVYNFQANPVSIAIYAHERDSFLVQRVFPHEITHLILYLYWQNNILYIQTKFIQEGLAQYNEYRLLTGLEEIVIHPTQKIPFENLLYPSFDSHETIKNFYQNSLAFISFLICKYGKYRFFQFIKKMQQNPDALKNLNEIYQFTLSSNQNKIIEEIEKQWDYFIRNSTPTPLK